MLTRNYAYASLASPHFSNDKQIKGICINQMTVYLIQIFLCMIFFSLFLLLNAFSRDPKGLLKRIKTHGFLGKFVVASLFSVNLNSLFIFSQMTVNRSRKITPCWICSQTKLKSESLPYER